MQTSELMSMLTQKLVLIQGLNVVALAFWMLLIYCAPDSQNIYNESESTRKISNTGTYPGFQG